MSASPAHSFLARHTVSSLLGGACSMHLAEKEAFLVTGSPVQRNQSLFCSCSSVFCCVLVLHHQTWNHSLRLPVSMFLRTVCMGEGGSVATIGRNTDWDFSRWEPFEQCACGTVSLLFLS